MNEVPYHHAVAGGSLDCDWQLPICDWRLALRPFGNRQSAIGNPETHPLPRGGTDLISAADVMTSIVFTALKKKRGGPNTRSASS